MGDLKILKADIRLTPTALKFLAFIFFVVILCLGYDFINFYYTTRHSRSIIIGKRDNSKKHEYMVVILEKYSSFPGHAYSLLEHSYGRGTMIDEAISFGPIHEKRTKSFIKVPGTLHNDSFRSFGNGSNFTLAKMIDETTYNDISQYLLKLHKLERSDKLKYRLWDLNCIAITDTVAKKSGLATPSRFLKFPKNYLKQLVDLNAEAAWYDSYTIFAKPEYASPPIFFGKESVFKAWIGSILYRVYFIVHPMSDPSGKSTSGVSS